MNAPYYLSEAAWRSEMLVSQAATRQAVRELGFLISALFLAYSLSVYLPGLAAVVGAVMCAGSIYAIWADNRSQTRSAEMAATAPELDR